MRNLYMELDLVFELCLKIIWIWKKELELEPKDTKNEKIRLKLMLGNFH
jgi:hypothetical protein